MYANAPSGTSTQPTDWSVTDSDDIIFKQGGGSGINDAPTGDLGFISYSFVARANAVHGFAMDLTPGPMGSTSQSQTEHSDVYLRLRNPGFTR